MSIKKLIGACLIVCFLMFIACQTKKSHINSNSEHQKYQNEFFKDASKSPLKTKDLKDFKGLDFFSIDSSYMVRAKLFRTPNTSYFEMKTTTDRITRERIFGVLSFSINNQPFVLNVYQGESASDEDVDADYLFLPFLDQSNGLTTYGGGRYIDLYIPVGDTLILDFNKAYNPFCAYNDKYSCPIVPRENYIPLNIMAGVKSFKNY
mgnify:FL=1|tara:strand:+ start:2481 stop:3098 length:618 start_codon:yes stop_codon:yes gene_type:complete